ncbi:MAG: hypothetical protein J2P23_04455 [Microlunatus sp.]|nr:hypothetical protein [Microlunatus sp.]
MSRDPFLFDRRAAGIPGAAQIAAVITTGYLVGQLHHYRRAGDRRTVSK